MSIPGKKLEHLALAPTPTVRSETVEALKRLTEIELARESEARKLRETMQEVVKSLAVMRGQLKLHSRLFTQLVRLADMLLLTNGAQGRIAGGVVDVMRIDLGTDTDTRSIWKNELARPVRARVRVVTAGVGGAAQDIVGRPGDSFGLRLDVTIIDDVTSTILLMPGQELFVKPTGSAASATVAVEVEDYIAWTEPGQGRPGAPV